MTYSTPHPFPEYARLRAAGVSLWPALVLSRELDEGRRRMVRGDDARAYSRHRRQASPAARDAHRRAKHRRTGDAPT